MTTVMSIVNYVISLLQFDMNSHDINEEALEEYKMLTDFESTEIIRYRRLFLKLNNNNEYMTKEIFKNIEGIALNPFNDRICQCFNLNNDNSKIDFKQFLIGLALFNSPGRRESKLKLAFTIQDFDNDGVINKEDLCIYLRRSTTTRAIEDNNNNDNNNDNTSFNEEVIQDIVKEVLRESSSDPKQEQLSFADFQRIVAPLDFQAKLVLPI